MKNSLVILLVGGVVVLIGAYLLTSESKKDDNAAPAQAQVEPTQETLLSSQFTGDEPVVPPSAPIDRPAATATAQARVQQPTSTPRPTLTPYVPTATPVPGQPAPIGTPVSSGPAPDATATTSETNVLPSQPPAPRNPPTPPLVAMEGRLYDAQNDVRATAGDSALTLDGTLTAVARQRAAEMATHGYFDGASPDGQTTYTLLDSIGYRYALVGENVARNNYPDAQAPDVAVAGFVNSPTHLANLLDQRFRYVGVGTALAADGMHYFVVVLSTD